MRRSLICIFANEPNGCGYPGSRFTKSTEFAPTPTTSHRSSEAVMGRSILRLSMRVRFERATKWFGAQPAADGIDLDTKDTDLDTKDTEKNTLQVARSTRRRRAAGASVSQCLRGLSQINTSASLPSPGGNGTGFWVQTRRQTSTRTASRVDRRRDGESYRTCCC